MDMARVIREYGAWFRRRILAIPLICLRASRTSVGTAYGPSRPSWYMASVINYHINDREARMEGDGLLALSLDTFS